MTTVTLKITNLGAGKDDSNYYRNVKFEKMFVVQHEVVVKPSFSSTQVYGRMDPIFSYQSTVRSFTLNMKTDPRLSEAGDAALRKKINSLHQMMYPLYEKEVNGTIPTFTLKGPPILQIECGGVFNVPTIFVPENFSLTRGTANSEKVNVTIGSLGELASFQAPVDGYAFTIGGTILHKEDPPGWERKNGQIVFTKGGNFPLG